MKHAKSERIPTRSTGWVPAILFPAILLPTALLLVVACGSAPTSYGPPEGSEGVEISDAPAVASALRASDLAFVGSASAVDSAEGQSPGLALDGELATYWQAAGEVPQALEIDLGPAVDIAEIQLTLFQEAAGASRQLVYGKGPLADDDYRLLHEFSGETSDEQVLGYIPETPWQGIRYLKIETAESPAPFGWRQVKVYPPDEIDSADPLLDSDGDGVPDYLDWCPDTPGTFENNGC